MVDALLVLQAAVTNTATANGTGLALPNGTARRPLIARVLASAFSAATGTSTVTFSVDQSANGGTTWATLASAAPITAAAVAASSEVFIPFVTPLADNANTATQIRLTATFSGSGVTTPTITYNCYIGDAMP